MFETTRDGVAAGRAGGSELVVAVEQEGNPRPLLDEGAYLVVADLGDMIEQVLASSAVRGTRGGTRPASTPALNPSSSFPVNEYRADPAGQYPLFGDPGILDRARVGVRERLRAARP